jgi:hypothetical protein
MAKALEGKHLGLSHSCHSEHHGAHKGCKGKDIKEQRPERATYSGSKHYMGRIILYIIVYSVSLSVHHIFRFGIKLFFLVSLACFMGFPLNTSFGQQPVKAWHQCFG